MDAYRHQSYPGTMHAAIDADAVETVVDLFDAKASEFAGNPAFTCLGRTLTYQELDRLSSAFAGYLQNE
ncbi:MAG: long-chain fatty acid--CoA ligase, partial [Gemmatimonadetes bacterium]|nr:long-chain fatty acid--CoA ligase [Gemmatimonadota bacterium]